MPIMIGTWARLWYYGPAVWSLVEFLDDGRVVGRMLSAPGMVVPR